MRPSPDPYLAVPFLGKTISARPYFPRAEAHCSSVLRLGSRRRSAGTSADDPTLPIQANMMGISLGSRPSIGFGSRTENKGGRPARFKTSIACLRVSVSPAKSISFPMKDCGSENANLTKLPMSSPAINCNDLSSGTKVFHSDITTARKTGD